MRNFARIATMERGIAQEGFVSFWGNLFLYRPELVLVKEFPKKTVVLAI